MVAKAGYAIQVVVAEGAIGGGLAAGDAGNAVGRIPGDGVGDRTQGVGLDATILIEAVTPYLAVAERHALDATKRVIGDDAGGIGAVDGDALQIFAGGAVGVGDELAARIGDRRDLPGGGVVVVGELMRSGSSTAADGLGLGGHPAHCGVGPAGGDRTRSVMLVRRPTPFAPWS